jgi:hypothetical protein
VTLVAEHVTTIPYPPLFSYIHTTIRWLPHPDQATPYPMLLKFRSATLIDAARGCSGFAGDL